MFFGCFKRASLTLFSALVASILSSVFTLAAQDSSKESQGNEIAARINGEVIPLSNFVAAVSVFELNFYQQLAQLDERGREKVLSEIRKQILDKMINETLILQEARRLRITVPKEEMEDEITLSIRGVKSRFPTEDAFREALQQQGLTEEGYREGLKGEVERKLIGQRWLEREVHDRVRVSDDEVSRYYRDNRSDFEIPEQVRVRHILILVPSEDRKEERRKRAQSILARARKGEDFADLARRFSEDPSAAQGGDLGFLRKGTMAPEFENVAFSLKEGQIGDVVLTQFGYHIIKAEERKERSMRALPEVSREVREKLTQQKKENMLNAKIKELRSKSRVEILVKNGAGG